MDGTGGLVHAKPVRGFLRAVFCRISQRHESAGRACLCAPVPATRPAFPTNFLGRLIGLAILSIVVLSLNSGRLSGLGFRVRAPKVPVGSVGFRRPIAPISKSHVVWSSYIEGHKAPSPGRNCSNAWGWQSFPQGSSSDGPRGPNQGMFRSLRDGSLVPSTLCAANAPALMADRPHGPDQTSRLAANHVKRTAISGHE